MDIREIKVLGGHDVTRHPDVMAVEIIDGAACDPSTGEIIKIEGLAELVGWGDIDGPAFDLSNGFTVPAHAWKWHEV